jgi:hypothetical protein
MDLRMMERVGDREEKMEGSCSTGQSPQWAVVPVEEEEEKEEEERTFIDVPSVKEREADSLVRWQFCLQFGMKNTRVANSTTWWDWMTFCYECR